MNTVREYLCKVDEMLHVVAAAVVVRESRRNYSAKSSAAVVAAVGNHKKSSFGNFPDKIHPMCFVWWSWSLGNNPRPFSMATVG